MPPSGSAACASKPADTITRSGRQTRTSGSTTSSIASAYSASPQPAGSGTLTVYPCPAPLPVSPAAPLIHGYHGYWCRETYSTSERA